MKTGGEGTVETIEGAPAYAKTPSNLNADLCRTMNSLTLAILVELAGIEPASDDRTLSLLRA